MSYPRLVARGSSETIHSADIERMATLTSRSSSCISDRQMTQYSSVQKSAVRKPNSGGMPRLPQRGRFTPPVAPVSETSRSSLLSRCVVPDSGRLTTSFGAAARAYGADWKKDAERLDSGFEEQQHSPGKLSLPSSLCGDDADSDRVGTRSAAVVTSSTPALKPRCIETDGAPVIMTTTVKTVDTAYFQKSEPTFPSHITEKPNVVPSPAIPTSTAASELYRQRLEGIKQQATEWLRLQKGLELLLPNTEGDTGLHQAIIHNKPAILNRLLDLVAQYPQLEQSINDQNALFQTGLHLAVHTQQPEVIRKLMKAGAHLHLQDHKGNTPLHIACRFSSTKCLDEILSRVSPSAILQIAQIRNFDGLSCVHMAVMSSNTQALLKLKGAGVDMNMKDHCSGKTPLHLAVEIGSFQLVQLLVQSCNANCNTHTYSGCTPLHVAAGRGQIELVAYLVSVGANPDACTDEGDTPLDLTTSKSVSLFLEQVAAINMEY